MSFDQFDLETGANYCRRVGNLSTSFGVYGFLFSTYGPTPVTSNCDIATLTLEVMAIVLIRVFVLRLRRPAKFEVRRPFCSEDITHFRSALVGLVTLTFDFDLKNDVYFCP